MTGEKLLYRAPITKPTLTVEKSLELQQWIVDPDSRPYTNDIDDRIIARSAGTNVVSSDREQKRSRLTIAEALELQQRILDNT